MRSRLTSRYSSFLFLAALSLCPGVRTAGAQTTLSASFEGLPKTALSGSQPSFTVVLSGPAPVNLAFVLQLTFQPDGQLFDDPMITFASGGRSVLFAIPAGTTTGGPFIFQTGSVAGVISFGLTQAQVPTVGGTIAVSPVSQAVTILRAVPAVVIVRLTNATSAGFEILVDGLTNTRELTQATYQFTPAAGSNLQQSTFTAPLTDAAAAYFINNPASRQFGGLFELLQTVTVQGKVTDVGSVTVTLSNSIGTSLPVTGTFNP